jgi:hypothetical protein
MEDISTILKLVGQLMTFNQGDVLGIPGFQIETLAGLDNNYEVERQAFTFQISTFDCVENQLRAGDIFTYDDTTYSYTFKLNRNPVSDLTGWSKLDVNLISKVEL